MFKLAMLKKYKLPILIVLLSFIFISILTFVSVRRQNRFKPSNTETPENPVATDSGGPVENLNEKFPESFPVYKTATVSSSWSKEIRGTEATSVVFESKDKEADVYNFYLSNLETNGWNIKDKKESKDFYSISFEKDSVSGFLGITKGSLNKTIISVTITSRKP